jgi:Ulp1 family protease
MKDLKLFFGQSWFNDTIIDTFFRCISFHSYHFSEVKMERNLPNEAITILSVSTRFWDKLLYLNSTGSRNSTAKYNYNNGYNYLLQNIFDFKIIYLPANINNNHWILIVIDVEKRKIFGFDSSNKHETNSNNMVHKYCGYIKQFILDDLIRKTDYTNIQKETTNEWHIDHNYLPNNQQNNGYDCGVFVCLNAVFCSKYKPGVGYERHKNLFDSQSITKFRKIMLYFFLTYFETY